MGYAILFVAVVLGAALGGWVYWDPKNRAAVPEFPEREPTEADDKYAARLRHFAGQWVAYFVTYYRIKSQMCRCGALTIRGIALIAMICGSVILVGRMLSPEMQTELMAAIHSNQKSVPAEVGLVLFALAAAMMVVDRFANISESWMRNVITRMSLQRMLVDFQLGGVGQQSLPPSPAAPAPSSVSATATVAPAVSATDAEYIRIKNFLGSVFDLVKHATQEWAEQFRKNRSDLESYLKVQEAAAKSEIESGRHKPQIKLPAINPTSRRARPHGNGQRAPAEPPPATV